MQPNNPDARTTNMKEILRLDRVEPAQPLADIILHKIQKEEARQARSVFVFTSLVGLLSLSLMYPILSNLTKEFTQSGFYEYLSLLFSDSGTALTYWKEFLLSLAESFPVFGVIILLIVGMAGAASIRSAVHSSRIAFNRQLA